MAKLGQPPKGGEGAAASGVTAPTGELGHRPFLAAVVSQRFMLQAALDGVFWGLALALATFLRYEFEVTPGRYEGLWIAVPLVVGIQVAAGIASGIYRGRWRLGSFEEVAALTKTIAVTAAAVGAVNAVARFAPLSVSFMAPVIALVLMGSLRYGWRLCIERACRPNGVGADRVVVFGAGEAGGHVITAMLRDQDSPYLPVALLDDDPAKRNLRLRGIPVKGDRHDLARVAASCDASTLLIAAPSGGSELVRELFDLAIGAGLLVKVLPAVQDRFGDIAVGEIRPLTEADLLGRREVDTDVEAMASYLTGKRVLVTGAGGSIGSELCRQLHRFAPAALVMADRDESALHAVQLSIDGRALLDDPNLVICDIRDRPRLDEVFARHRPQVVFHAAALKHLTLLEGHPGEALKTNVWGTQHVLAAAVAAGVERFVNVSTDKAADPSSVLGYSKRITERLTAYTDTSADGDYLSVRFGNVLGSRGSVLTTFRAQIDRGGPVTVTHPDVTRFFMTVEEAVQLVIQAGAIGGQGDVLVLDMGEPVRVAQVARQMADRAEGDIEIVYTGLRPGEKMHEVLLAADETGERPVHPMIAHVPVPPLDPATVLALRPDAVTPILTSTLARLSRQPWRAAEPTVVNLTERPGEQDAPVPTAPVIDLRETPTPSWS